MSAPVNFRVAPDPDQAIRDDWTSDELRAMDAEAFDRVFEQTGQAGGWGHGASLNDLLDRQERDAAAGTERQR